MCNKPHFLLQTIQMLQTKQKLVTSARIRSPSQDCQAIAICNKLHFMLLNQPSAGT